LYEQRIKASLGIARLHGQFRLAAQKD
jgi:hypothetical protein